MQSKIANNYEKPFIQTEVSMNDKVRPMKDNIEKSQSFTVSQFRSRLDKLENSIEIISNKLDILTNLMVKIYNKND